MEIKFKLKFFSSARILQNMNYAIIQSMSSSGVISRGMF